MARSRRSELRAEKALRFIEELSWLLKSHDAGDLKYLNELLQQARHGGGLEDDVTRLSRYVEGEDRPSSLVGILPRIFMNTRWFASNADIAEFADAALGMTIPRWGKISKFEMIGHIVCNLALNEKRTHSRLVSVLTDILADRNKSQFVTDMRKDQMSWNEIIRRFG